LITQHLKFGAPRAGWARRAHIAALSAPRYTRRAHSLKLPEPPGSGFFYCIRAAGVSRHAISEWRYRSSLSLANFEAALGALGYELKIVEEGSDEDCAV
jgi:hypothetical protein